MESWNERGSKVKEGAEAFGWKFSPWERLVGDIRGLMGDNPRGSRGPGLMGGLM